MKLNDLDFNKLAVFSQVVESGSYRLAAEVLLVTPSALSQTISRLEQSLGFALFHRTGRKLVPTANGLRLSREFRRHQESFFSAVQDISTRQDKVVGTLKVGAYLEFAKSQLAPAIHSFTRKFPQAQLKLSFDRPSRLHAQLDSGALDLCFSIYPSVERKKIESRPVYHEELVLISPIGLLATSVGYEEILASPLIDYYETHQTLSRWLQTHFRRRPKRISGVRVYAATAEMVLALVEQGLGLGVVPRFLLHPDKLQKVEILRPTPRRVLDHIWMLENRTARSNLHAEFRAHVLAHLRSLP